ncbi:hypothetical protein BABINDRAFT_11195 [Babjeviella inositovora NRRL Y-12698]|uniref:Small ribosomal subunit protein mS29 n=1 Tax=Babjeviella inositovora NRRL Y-12698 TaxID=984486 RepID=A0A1E3R0D3_9ASCO|nr:uncharacterized protein BABINDRAFT_11195 [Babjeviella inositovora NRRL Y-12698]ODQ82837.1 hypothetical protein BABINDRAFT_11195 [Babjeviella inositovora NRRL Y-12698]
MLRAQITRNVSLLHARAFQTATPLSKGAAKVVATKKRKQTFNPSKGKSGEKATRAAGSSVKGFVHEVSFTGYNKGAENIAIAALGAGALQKGTVCAFEGATRRDLAHFGSFHKLQYHELFKNPISLVRDETLQVDAYVQKAVTSPSSENVLLVSGKGGAGKTSLLAQAHALALQRAAIVLPINNADSLVDGSNDFLLNTETGRYQQPMFVKNFLHKILCGNKAALQALKLSQEYVSHYKGKQTKYDAQTSLYDYIKSVRTSLDTKNNAYFATIIAELAKQDQFPVFFTVDKFSTFTHNPYTQYRNTENAPIHFSDFELPALLLDFVSGAQSFKRGGVILATSDVHKRNDTFRVMLGEMQPRPYVSVEEYDPTVGQVFLQKKVQRLAVAPLDLAEIRALTQTFIAAKVIPEKEAEKLEDEEAFASYVKQKYVLSGNGNFRELLKSVVLFY